VSAREKGKQTRELRKVMRGRREEERRGEEREEEIREEERRGERRREERRGRRMREREAITKLRRTTRYGVICANLRDSRLKCLAEEAPRIAPAYFICTQCEAEVINKREVPVTAPEFW
jgi:hypothetical protein